MKVRDLLEKLSSVDPELEVGHQLYDVSGYVTAVSAVGTAEDGGKTVLVLGSSQHDGTLFPDEVGFEEL